MYRQPYSGFNRVPFIRTCTLVQNGLDTTCLICNLSILGVYLHLEAVLERGCEVTLRFRVADHEPEIEAVAVVAWVNEVPPEGAAGLPLGCGLRFIRVAPDDLRRIAALVAEFLTAPQEKVQVGIEQPFTGRVRVPFITPCTLAGRFGVRHGSVCNLSTLGAYVAIDEIPARGTRGSITFHLPGDGQDLTTDFKVTWQNPDLPNRVHALPPGCGLLFESLGVREEKLLAAFVNDYLQTVAT